MVTLSFEIVNIYPEISSPSGMEITVFHFFIPQFPRNISYNKSFFFMTFNI